MTAILRKLEKKNHIIFLEREKKQKHKIKETSAIVLSLYSECHRGKMVAVVSNKQFIPENWALPGDGSAGPLQPLTLPDSLRDPTSTH